MPTAIKQHNSSNTHISIPDLLHNWPWERRVSPHLAECKAETDMWMRGFHVFSPEGQAAFDKCAFSKMAGFAHHGTNG